MIAFEILKNGKRLYTCGAGELGHLNASAMWMRMKVDNEVLCEHAGFTAVSTQGIGGPTSIWPTAQLIVGDEITLRMIETDSFDPPEQTSPPPIIDPDGGTIYVHTTRNRPL